jgi:phage protein U
MVSKTSIAFFRALVCSKEGHVHLMALEHLSHQRRHFHVASVKGQVQGLFAVILGGSASETCPNSYQYDSIATPSP